MEFLANNIALNLPPKALAEVFDRLIWCLDDNGSELMDARDEWLMGGDFKRIAIALAMDETFPFGGGPRMQEHLERIAAQHPELSDRCNELMRQAKKYTPACPSKQ